VIGELLEQLPVRQPGSIETAQKADNVVHGCLRFHLFISTYPYMEVRAHTAHLFLKNEPTAGATVIVARTIKKWKTNGDGLNCPSLSANLRIVFLYSAPKVRHAKAQRR